MPQYPLLDSIHGPDDVKRLPASDLAALCSELREFLIENVSKTGGHLASNLGAVEIGVALHRVYHSPADKLMFDVGHQAYVHKILTGRRDRFGKLRTMGGLGAFLRPDESEHDCFVSGHASNSVSAILGMARARTLLGQDGDVVCVLGDGALTGGMAYEALNDAGQSGEPLVVILNDNEMSISRNVGAIAKRLSAARLKPQYLRLKSGVKRVLRRLPGGKRLIRALSGMKKRIRVAILKETVFELMGFRYIGPADGHDIHTVCALLEQARSLREPVVVHLKTVKGRGYCLSEANPTGFHGVAAFDVATGKALSDGEIAFSDVFGESICAYAGEDARVCAITAAMEEGTGLAAFARRYPKRFFDVGIAEEHAVTLASGMAAQGMRPVCAIYSTFLQRAYDQIIHDVAIMRNPVVFAVDRAGVVGADGATHQGIFDVPMLLGIPHMRVLAPSSYAELHAAFRQALFACDGPCAVRYPRGGEGAYRDNAMDEPQRVLYEGADVTIVAYGIMINEALAARKRLLDAGRSAEIIKINCLTAFDMAVIARSYRKTKKLIVVEDCVESGSVGQRIAAHMAQCACADGRVRLLNFKSSFVPEGGAAQLYAAYGIDAQAVADAALADDNG